VSVPVSWQPGEDLADKQGTQGGLMKVASSTFVPPRNLWDDVSHISSISERIEGMGYLAYRRDASHLARYIAASGGPTKALVAVLDAMSARKDLKPTTTPLTRPLSKGPATFDYAETAAWQDFDKVIGYAEKLGYRINRRQAEMAGFLLAASPELSSAREFQSAFKAMGISKDRYRV
jgi:hypothetical protein